MSMPETRYARSGDVMIAYQVVGEGPFDMVIAPGAVSHVELGWRQPVWRRCCEDLPNTRECWCSTSGAQVCLTGLRGHQRWRSAARFRMSPGAKAGGQWLFRADG